MRGLLEGLAWAPLWKIGCKNGPDLLARIPRGPNYAQISHQYNNASPKDWEEEEEFITSGKWRGKHNSLSRGAGADPP